MKAWFCCDKWPGKYQLSGKSLKEMQFRLLVRRCNWLVLKAVLHADRFLYPALTHTSAGLGQAKWNPMPSSLPAKSPSFFHGEIITCSSGSRNTSMWIILSNKFNYNRSGKYSPCDTSSLYWHQKKHLAVEELWTSQRIFCCFTALARWLLR